MEPTTKTFDAVAESRKWRETTSRKLDAMSLAERLEYLKAAGERHRAQIQGRPKTAPASSSATRDA
jgi:hypothetical protein